MLPLLLLLICCLYDTKMSQQHHVSNVKVISYDMMFSTHDSCTTTYHTCCTADQ